VVAPPPLSPRRAAVLRRSNPAARSWLAAGQGFQVAKGKIAGHRGQVREPGRPVRPALAVRPGIIYEPVGDRLVVPGRFSCSRLHRFAVGLGPRRPGDPARIVASGELAAHDLGWAMTRSLEDMVSTAWDATRHAERNGHRALQGLQGLVARYRAAPAMVRQAGDDLLVGDASHF